MGTNVGKEYDAYFDERYGFIADIGKHISDTAGNMYENSQLHLAQRWTRNMWTKIFPDIIESMNREDKLSKKELETEAKEMTKRFIEFIYAYTQIPETEQGIELLLNYTYEELGLKD